MLVRSERSTLETSLILEVQGTTETDLVALVLVEVNVLDSRDRTRHLQVSPIGRRYQDMIENVRPS